MDEHRDGDHAEPENGAALRITLTITGGGLHIEAPAGMPLDIVRSFLVRAADFYTYQLTAQTVLAALDQREHQRRELGRLNLLR